MQQLQAHQTQVLHLIDDHGSVGHLCLTCPEQLAGGDQDVVEVLDTRGPKQPLVLDVQRPHRLAMLKTHRRTSPDSGELGVLVEVRQPSTLDHVVELFLPVRRTLVEPDQHTVPADDVPCLCERSPPCAIVDPHPRPGGLDDVHRQPMQADEVDPFPHRWGQPFAEAAENDRQRADEGHEQHRCLGALGEEDRPMQADHGLPRPRGTTDPGRPAPGRAHELQLVGMQEGHPVLDRAGQVRLEQCLGQFVRIEERLAGLLLRAWHHDPDGRDDWSPPRFHVVRREVVVEYLADPLDLLGVQPVSEPGHPGCDVVLAQQGDP